MARQAASRLLVGSARRGRAALLRATALQAATALVFVSQAAAQLAPTARPTGGQVVAGGATIGQTTAQTTVKQTTQRAAIEWQSFDVGSQHTVQFNQPSTSAVTLNRVTGPDPSQIAGRINANGNIIITNPAGVAFSQGAQVNVNSLIVSAPGITNQNFMAGNMVFDQAPNPGAAVTNAGTITVKETGLAALVAPRVANSGTINARLGRVVLAGAEAHTIDLYGDGLVAIDVTKAVSQMPPGPDGKPVTALVTNTGTVIADGGSVQITARAADGIVQDLVRAGGTIRANAVGGRTGSVAIAGVGGSVRVEGAIAASGGTVAVNASNTVTVASGATISVNGGGTVALGTTLARAQAGRQAALTGGAAPGTPAGTARRVVVEAGATVSADAAGAGNGGTVVVLSTQSTQIDGMLTTLGGGVIEASSDGVLALNQAPNAGQGGTLYLDPYDLIIGTGTPNATLGGSQSNPSIPLDGSTSGTSYISPATLAQAAQNGAVSISLNATHDLTVREAVTLTQGQTSGGGGTGGASLYLHADHDLNVLANITIGAAGSGRTLTLDANHNIFIGPAAGAPAVTLAVDGAITMTTTASFTGDPAAASITVHDNTVLTSNASISLEASNRIDIGSNVQMIAGPNGGFNYAPDEGSSYTGILLQAGSDITVANNSRLSAIGAGDSATPVVILDAGGSVTVGTNNALNAGGSFGNIYLYAGSSTERSGGSGSISGGGNPNAPAVNTAGALSVGGGTSISGASFIDIRSGTAGTTTLDAGSLVQADGSSTGFTGLSNVTVEISSGTGGTLLNGTITGGVGGTIDLSSGGAVQQQVSGVIIADNLTGTAASYNLIGTANQITQIGANDTDSLTARTGDVTIVNSTALTVGANPGSTGGGIQVANGRTITLVTDSLTIGAGEQPIPASESTIPYTLYAPGGAVVIQPATAGQQVELINGTKTAGRLSITQSELLNVAADRLQLGSSTAGTLTLSGALDLSSGRFTVDGSAAFLQLDLVSGGQITQSGTITVNTLTANGTDVSLFGGPNQIGNLGASSASAGNFNLNNGTTRLTLTGALTASDQIYMTLDSLAFGPAASVTASALQLAPYSTGRQVELVQGTQSATRLSVNQAMINVMSVDDLILGGGGPGQGDIVIGNPGDTVNLNGHVNILSLIGPGAVSEGAGASLQVGFFEIPNLFGAGTEISTVTMNGPNQIGRVFSETTGAFSLTNVGTLQLDVVQSGASITVNNTGNVSIKRDSLPDDGSSNGIAAPTVSITATGNISLDQGAAAANVVRATNSLTLQADGTLTQNFGTIVAGTLTGRASSATLTLPGNQIDNLGAFTATTGGFSLADSSTLSVTGGVSVANGQTLSLTSNSIGIPTGGSLSAPGGTVALAPYTAGTAFSLGGFVPAGAITASTLQVGNATTGNITIAGSFTLTNVGTLDLRSAAAITEGATDSITVGTLKLQADSASLIGQNQIGTLGAFTVTNALSLTNTADLAVNGPGTAGALTLAVSGAITQSAATGSVTASTLTIGGAGGTQPASISLGGANRIGVLTAQSRGDITFVNAQALRVDVASTPGNVNVSTTAGDLFIARTSTTSDRTANGVSGAVVALSANGNLLFEAGSHPENAVRATTSLALNAGGTITQDSGTIITPILTGFAAGASLVQPGNQINSLGNFIVSSDFTLSDSVGLTIGGLVSVGGGRTLSLASDSVQIGAGGTLSAPGGTVAIAPLTTGNPLTLTSAPSGNIVADTLRFGSATTGDITIAGTFNLTDVGTLDLRSAGTISESVGGALQVGTLTGQANRADLTGPNQIDRLGNFTVAGLNLPTGINSAFRLRNDKSLAVVGNVTATANNVVIDTSFAQTADVTISTPISTPGGDFVVYAGRNITVASGATIAAPNGGLFLEASFNANSPTAAGAVHVNGALSAASVFLGAGADGIDLAANVTGVVSVALRGQGNTDGSLIDLNRGPITQSAGIITTASLSARGTSVLLDGNNQIASLGVGKATTGDFVLTTASPLSVNAPVTVSNGATIAIASNGIQFNGGGLSAPAGLITLTPFTPGAAFALGGNVASGAVTAATLQIGNAATGPITIDGSLSFDQVGTLDLRSAGAISQTNGSSVTVGNLTVTAASAALSGSNSIGTLDAFTVTGAFALTDTANLIVAGPGAAGSLALTTGGSVQFAGAIAVTGALSVKASGSVTQTGGTLTAASLTGSATGSAEFGVKGSTQITTLGAFSLAAGAVQEVFSATSGALATPTSFNLTNGAPLIVAGPLSSGSVALSAVGALILQGGQVAADNATISVSNSLNGIATLTQTGTTAFSSLSSTAGALTLALPGNGGAITLQNLSAPSMSLSLNLGTAGTATGAIDVSALQVLGQSGGASLTGRVGGQGGATAAAISAISPRVSTAYTLNGCTISVANCGLVTASAPALPVELPTVPPVIVTPEPFQPIGNDFSTLLTPKSFLDTALGNIFKSDLFIVDLITIGIVRDPANPDLMLPNISDRDY